MPGLSVRHDILPMGNDDSHAHEADAATRRWLFSLPLVAQVALVSPMFRGLLHDVHLLFLNLPQPLPLMREQLIDLRVQQSNLQFRLEIDAIVMFQRAMEQAVFLKRRFDIVSPLSV